MQGGNIATFDFFLEMFHCFSTRFSGDDTFKMTAGEIKMRSRWHGWGKKEQGFGFVRSVSNDLCHLTSFFHCIQGQKCMEAGTVSLDARNGDLGGNWRRVI